MKNLTMLIGAVVVAFATSMAHAERNEDVEVWTPARELKHFDIKVPTPNLVENSAALKLNGVTQLALFCTEGKNVPLYRHATNSKWITEPAPEPVPNQSELAAKYWVGFMTGETMTYLPTTTTCARTEADPVAVVVEISGKFELGASIYASEHRNIERQRHMKALDLAIPMVAAAISEGK